MTQIPSCHRRARAWLCAAGIASGLGGCMVGPNYHRPDSQLPQAFHEVKPLPAGEAGRIVTESESLEQWWTVFQDPELNSLVERALQGNRDLKMAIARVRQSRFERAVIAGELLPEVAVTAGYDRALGSRNVQIPLSQLAGSSSGASSGGSSSTSAGPNRADAVSEGGAGSGGAPAAASSPSAPLGGPNSPFGEGGLPGVTTNLYQVGFDASWELDLFGGGRRAVQAADAEVLAAAEGARAVRVSLLAEVANTYLQLRSAQERTGIARRNRETQRQTYEIARDKFRTGLGNESPMEQQLAQLRTTEATLPALDGAIRATEHQIAFLLGEDPDALVGELDQPLPLPALPPTIPIGVPSELLRRRPDVRQAERELAASSANVGVATAALFPQFSITGAFGLDSSTLKQLPEWSSRYYSISPGIQWPILDWGRVHDQIHVQNALQEQALLSYQTAVAQALKDVADALVNYQNERSRRVALALAAGAAQRARLLARQTYASGLTDEISALTAESQSLQADDALAQSDARLRTDLVALYKALGGGWRLDDPSRGSG